MGLVFAVFIALFGICIYSIIGMIQDCQDSSKSISYKIVVIVMTITPIVVLIAVIIEAICS